MTQAAAVASDARTVPSSVRWAAAALATYGVLVLVLATVLQAQVGWVEASEYPRAVIRAVGTMGTAWALLRNVRVAWWVGVILPCLWLAQGVIGIALLVNVSADVAAVLSPGQMIGLVLGIPLLLAAVILLLVPASRTAFRKPAP